MDYKENMSRKATRNRNALTNVTVLTQEYVELVEKRNALTKGSNRTKGTLFAIVEKVARELHLNGKIESVRPKVRLLENNLTEEEITLRLNGLYQKNLVQFLYKIEKSLQGITVRSLNIKQTKQQLLDVDISLIMVTSAK